MPSHLNSRQTLRRQLRQARRDLSVDEQQTAAENLLTCFQQHFLGVDHSPKTPINNVALYLANDGEISPHLLCEHFWQKGINTYLPVIQNKQLAFALYSEETIWQENIYGIKEPMTKEYLPKEALDIVLLPLVGFDTEGGRLGMGGGFYDRTFEGKKTTEAPLLIGLAHDCQQVKSLPVEGWDVPLQAFITPTQVIKA
ncbi:5-formyltetrahydrofolate cyclo-ligase [Marinomonas ushuaiensis DSM 15871]|uniref:5-formyltetrahydrofolate cyclo-ligase n=1 Tax=Marinomonas ushuaiensis DSM 15871 TaxID=1122207 RepID=X7E615_9GAMM|nr:5-formyltetrahydrofolate cyclo-ligase [Marinomonas ushuaiensis]ETX10631.1 5-formyltetrahydrofolate cyclo-ligase [Marinomonas ushuaiensis DSM 15871]